MMQQINKAMQPVRDRIKMMVARAVIKAINDSGGVQRIKVGLLADELKDNIERFQNYGFTSHPHAGAEAAVMFLGGNRDHGIIVAIDDKRYRIKGLQGGEVAIYDDLGTKIVLKRGNEIEITASVKVRIDTPRLEVTGDIIDNCDDQPDTVREMRETYNIHTHPEDATGNTETPNQLMGT